MLPAVIQIVVIVLALAFVVWRQLRARELKVSRLWLVPALLTYESWRLMPANIGLAAIAAAAVGLVVGLALGVFRARFYTMVPNPAKGTIAVKGSPWALLVWGAIFAFKLGARFFTHTASMSGHLDTLSFALMVLALGMLLGTRGRMLYVYNQGPQEVAAPVMSPADPL
ncbi:MAG TPA: hypothetical protein V6D47_22350 [Oscillatoriaceae cyanobacterium]